MTDTTDRELLGRAAKAAGIEFRPGVGGGIWIPSGSHLLREWNPLLDDGEALRLAAMLGMNIDMTPGKFVEASIIKDDKRVSGVCDCGPAPDYYAATRRAIVRAAAEIGKALP